MDYPSNARRQRDADDIVVDIRKGQQEDKSPGEKKVERVIEGEVVRRKKPLGKRVKEFFIAGDAKSVWGYVVGDVLLPAAKDTIVDATSEYVQRMMFGESRHRRPSSSRGPNGYVSYNRYSPSSRSSAGQDRLDQRREVSRRARASHNFDEIILETRGEAEEVIDRLFDLISRYEIATVEDLYELTGISGNYTDRKWGWTDIRGAGVSRVRSGYLLDLPRPEPLD